MITIGIPDAFAQVGNGAGAGATGAGGNGGAGGSSNGGGAGGSAGADAGDTGTRTKGGNGGGTSGGAGSNTGATYPTGGTFSPVQGYVSAGAGSGPNDGGGGGGAGVIAGGSLNLVAALVQGGAGGIGSGTAGSGGGGVGLLFTGSGTLTLDANTTISGGGGGGVPNTATTDGGGGVGVYMQDAGTLNNKGGIIFGGNGGYAGNPGGAGGGAAVVLNSGATVNNTGGAMIFGGSTYQGVSAAGILILGNGNTVNNAGAGSVITGGRRSTGTTSLATGIIVNGSNNRIYTASAIHGGATLAGPDRGNAIDFAGDNNRLELWDGYSFNGNVVATGSSNVFALGGTSSPAAPFDVSQIGPSAQFQGFSAVEKAGTSTWTATGVVGDSAPWAIVEGRLKLGDGTNTGDLSPAGSVTVGTSKTVTNATLDISGVATASSTIQNFSGNGKGQVILGSAATLTLNQPAAGTTYGGTFTGGTATTGLTIASGMLTLTGASSSYTGLTTVKSGATLVVGVAGSGSLGPYAANAPQTTDVQSGGTLRGGGTIGGTVNVSGTLLVQDESAIRGGPSKLSIGGNLMLNAGANMNYVYDVSPNGAHNALMIEVGGTATITTGAKLSVTGPGTTSLLPGSYGLLSATQVNGQFALSDVTIPKGTQVRYQSDRVELVAGDLLHFWNDNNPVGSVQGGSGTWNKTGANWTDATGQEDGAYAQGSFAVFEATGGTVTVTETSTVGGMQFSVNNYSLVGPAALTLSPTPSVTAGGEPQSFIRVGNGNLNDINITATIAVALNGDVQLVKADGGKLVLSGNNGYTGGTLIQSGVLSVSADGNLGAASGALTLDGGTLRVTGGYAATSRGVTLDAGGGTFDIANSSFMLSNAIGGSGGLVKTGAGTLVLAGTNTYGGDTLIEAGTLQIAQDANLGAADGALAFAGGTLQNTAAFSTTRAVTLTAPGGTFQTDAGLTLSGTIAGNGALTKTGDATVILTGSNTYSGGTFISAGTLQFGDGGPSGSIAGDVTNNAALTFNRSDRYAFAGAISGSGMVTQVGAGTTVLSGKNSYTGRTVVAAGTLAAGAANAFSAASDHVVRAGGTLALDGFDETVAALENAGMVRLGGASAPDTTLTVTGDYTGQGGTVALSTVLGDDNSRTDRLVVQGDTSGDTLLAVRNAGGQGAQTSDGIKVIAVDGTSAGRFMLQGDFTFEGDPAVVGGAYAYRLYQGGVATPGDGDWYLRSTLEHPHPTPPNPHYQPGAPVYEAYGQALLELNGVGTVRERLGNRLWREDQPDITTAATSATMPDANGMPFGSPLRLGTVWGRLEAGHGSFAPHRATSSMDYDTNSWKLQAGLDAGLKETARGDLIGGLFVQYGTVSADVGSPHGDGGIDANGYGFGGTLTWFGADGLYVDGVAQATWYDSDLTSSTASRDLVTGNDGFGYALSLEAGKEFTLTPNWSLTPQAQLVYSSVDFDSFTDTFGARVSRDTADSLKGRAGLAADYRTTWRDQNGQAASARLYGLANLTYEMLDGVAIDLSNSDFATANDRLWGGLGVGGSYSWADNKYALHGELAVDTSLANFADSYAGTGNVGLKVRW